MRKNNTAVHTTWLLMGVSMSMALIGCKPADKPAAVSVEETRTIAKEAYLWGFPMVESYKALYVQAVNSTGSDFRAPFNHIGSAANVFTPKDTAIITPNSDTPYSFIWMDLRAEPLVLTIPKIDKDRYFSVQLVDLYTHNFDYLGSRTTGNDGGIYLIAGPDWQGEAPSGVQKVIRPETQIAYAIYRTQLFGEKDLDNVRQIQAGYLVQPLSTFLGASAPPAAPAIDFPPYDGEIPMFEAMFAQSAELRLALVHKLLYESGGNGVAVVARALRLTREEFATIYLLTRRARPGSGGGAVDLGRALGFYDKVSAEAAMKVLERWRRDPQYLFAIKTIEQGVSHPGGGPTSVGDGTL